ncbi:hypothetical protein WH47_07441, partial [Habropoda laboriosa]
RRSLFYRIKTTELLSFPQLSIHELYFYTCGAYQLKQAPGYYADHINENGDFELQIASISCTINCRDY